MSHVSFSRCNWLTNFGRYTLYFASHSFSTSLRQPSFSNTLFLLELNFPVLAASPLSVIGFIRQKFDEDRRHSIPRKAIQANAFLVIISQLTALQPNPLLEFLPFSVTPVTFLELLTRVYVFVDFQRHGCYSGLVPS